MKTLIVGKNIDKWWI